MLPLNLSATHSESQMNTVNEGRQAAASASTPAGAASTTRAAHAPTIMPAEFLSFRLGGEEYGIDILRVQEIRSYEAPTRIANASHFIKGVVNLRGVIVPIVDLRLRLACETAEYNEFTVVIVLNVRGRVIGAVVDSVSDVLALGADSIKPAPEMNASVDAGLILGIGCVNSGNVERILILTDIEALMGGSEMGLMDASLH
jgi:purine-binding chemotaxis protein CheW